MLVGILICAIFVWIYFMQYHKIKTHIQVFTDDFIQLPMLKTGDLILFKAYNNFNSIIHGSYFGHVGIIYVDEETKIPYLFEANGVEKMPLLPHHNKNGIFLTPVADRIKKYKGRCFYKPLNKKISPDVIDAFSTFIKYSLENMSYDYEIFKGGLRRKFLGYKCNKKTDCGQLVFLSLVKLQLLPLSYYEISCANYLKYVCELTSLDNDYKYMDLIEVIEHPFAF